MGQLRIKLQELEMPPTKKRAKKHRPGYCKGCGAKLVDEASLKSGYGPKCFEKCFVIVLEMIPDKESAGQE